jgi:hypothetical protein
MPLTTIQKVKSYLPEISDSSDDNFIQDLIDDVQSTIESYCGRKFDVDTFTETQMCKHKVFPKNTPLKSVESIIRDDNVLTAADYKIRGNYIQFLGDMKVYTMAGSVVYANDSKSEVTISYTAGYDPDKMPKDLTLAATKLVAIEYKDSRENRLGVEQESEGDVKYTYSKKDSEMPLNISCVLDRYKKVTL